MQETWYKKALVCAVIILFVGMAITSSSVTIIGDIHSLSDTELSNGIFDPDGTTLYVGGSGPGNYSRIQDAIDNASDDDTVFVYNDSSPYYENVVVNKRINLIGQSRDNTIIEGGPTTLSILENQIFVDRFTITSTNPPTTNIGIVIESSNSIIRNCNIQDITGFGITIDSGNNNHIYHNNFINILSDNALDSFANNWDNGYPSGGNYWDDYDGSDDFSGPGQNISGSDGIGDTPYIIDEDNQDNYPLMGPWGDENRQPQITNPNPANSETNVPINLSNLTVYISDPEGDSFDWCIGNHCGYGEHNGTKSAPLTTELEYNTTYIWNVNATDPKGSGVTAKALFMFTTEPEPTGDPDLDCTGSLTWTDVDPGDTVTDSFKLRNNGDEGSELDWSISSHPEWGTWAFEPESGDDLTKEEGWVTVQVSVEAPDEENKEFTGKVTIVNDENNSDKCTINVKLVTPKNKQTSLLFQFLDRLLERFPLLREILLRLFPVLNRVANLR